MSAAPEVLNRLQFQKQLPGLDWDKAAPYDEAVIGQRVMAARRHLAAPYLGEPRPQDNPGQQRLFQ